MRDLEGGLADPGFEELLAEIAGPLGRHDVVEGAVMDADGCRDALKVVNRRDALQVGVRYCENTRTDFAVRPFENLLVVAALVAAHRSVEHGGTDLRVDSDDTEGDPAAHAVTEQVNVTAGGASERAGLTCLFANDRHEIEDVDRVTNTEVAFAPAEGKSRRLAGRREVAIIRMDGEVVGLGQGVGVAGGVGDDVVDLGLDIAMQNEGNREGTLASRYVHETVDGQAITGVGDDRARELGGDRQRGRDG